MPDEPKQPDVAATDLPGVSPPVAATVVTTTVADPAKKATLPDPAAAPEVVPTPEAEMPDNKNPKVPPVAPPLGNATATAAAPDKKPDVVTPPGTPAEGDAGPQLGSKFMSDDNMKELLQHLGQAKLAKELEEVLANNEFGPSKFGKDKDGNPTLTLGANQHVIDFGKLPDGRDFIGLGQAHSDKFDAHDARALVGLAKTKGWASITVHGNEEQKGALWLEAKRMGLGVRDFEPDPKSKFALRWKIDEANLAKQQPDPVASITPVPEVPVMAVSGAAPAASTNPPPPAKTTRPPAAGPRNGP